MIKTGWLNVTKVVHPELEKPCETLDYCPYGTLVEEFPLQEPHSSELSCPFFGHDCPVHYHAELVGEE